MLVEGELAEAVGEVMARFAPGGVVIESTGIDENPDTPGSPTGSWRVFCYLPVDDQLEEKRGHLEEALWYLGRIQSLPPIHYKTIPQADWMSAWKQHYRPLPVGRGLVIVPSWLEAPPGKRIPIKIDPGMAFGTGTHPTTQLCLEMLEDFTPAGGEVIDVGCGSGILSIAALKLGAAKALGVDVDPQAIESAGHNAEANKVADRAVFEAGSVAEIKRGDFFIRDAPLVVANMLAPILVRLLEGGMADLVAPGGRLILSGILEEQEERVLEALKAQGLKAAECRQQEDWVGLVGENNVSRLND